MAYWLPMIYCSFYFVKNTLSNHAQNKFGGIKGFRHGNKTD